MSKASATRASKASTAARPGALEANATFDPLSDFEEFEFRFRARDLQLKRMNDFASAYGKFDFKAGTGDVVIEAQAENGRLTGYIAAAARCGGV